MVDAGRPRWIARRSGPTFFLASAPDDLGLDSLGDPSWGVPRSAGAVVEAVGAELEIAVPPLRGAPAGDAHGRRHVCNVGAGLDPATQQESSLRGERGVTVTHGDLRGVCVPSTAAHLPPEVFASVDPYRVTNVRERNTWRSRRLRVEGVLVVAVLDTRALPQRPAGGAAAGLDGPSSEGRLRRATRRAGRRPTQRMPSGLRFETTSLGISHADGAVPTRQAAAWRHPSFDRSDHLDAPKAPKIKVRPSRGSHYFFPENSIGRLLLGCATRRSPG